MTVDGVAATGTILDNDKPSVTGVEVGTDADADSVVEGNALNFNVTLSEATQSEVTYTLDLPVSADVDLSTVTFSAGVSYDAVTKLLTVEAGVTDFTITVPTVDDSIVEAAEDYIVTVDGVAATGTILDNDKPSVTGVEVGTDADADSVVEGNAPELQRDVIGSNAIGSDVHPRLASVGGRGSEHSDVQRRRELRCGDEVTDGRGGRNGLHHHGTDGRRQHR